MFIASNWEEYFSNHHEGLGTTYERFILHSYFEKIKAGYSVQTVLEAPSFGMTGISGINSLWWGLHGANVTVVDENEKRIEHTRAVWQGIGIKADFVCLKCGYPSLLPFRDRSFDMGWNFASLSSVCQVDSFLGELARVTKKVIFICVPNPLNLAYLVASRIRAPKSMPLDNMSTGKTRSVLEKAGWITVEQGFLDVPPWPDIAMRKEDLFERFGLKRLALRLKANRDHSICILDYYSGKNRNMDKEILKYAFLEDSPRIPKRFWAHHRYLIFAPRY
jgi:hypothetical protein